MINRRTRPCSSSIIKYWLSKESTYRLSKYRDTMLFDEELLELKSDYGFITPFCFACFEPRSQWNKLERAHVIPHMLGGSNRPSNFVMLCHGCHLDNPNTRSEDVYFQWIKNVKNYKTKRTESVIEALSVFGVSCDMINILYNIEGNAFVSSLMQSAKEDCGLHQGLNTNTFAGAVSVKIKEYFKTRKELREQEIRKQNRSKCIHQEKQSQPVSQPIGDQMELF